MVRKKPQIITGGKDIGMRFCGKLLNSLIECVVIIPFKCFYKNNLDAKHLYSLRVGKSYL